jgi:hypothetical protein
MFRLNLDKKLALVLLSVLIATPVAAHTEKVSGDVGGILHIEPYDNPHAGKTAQAWIALTRKGGGLIPLTQCNCQLAVYPEPHTEGNPPLLKPQLHPVSNRRYQGIPGADIVFPKVGSYELELTGTPKNRASFKPFTLSYNVDVVP